jgi:predicted DNA-binding WGR domain protein
MSGRKIIGTWKGKLTIYGKVKERTIQIAKVPNQKNKIVIPGFNGLEEGTLLAAKRKKPTLWSRQGPNGNLEFVFVTYSGRGSYQGSPMHTYNKHVAFASKDEKTLDSLMKFLTKHITKGRVKKTVKRGGGSITPTKFMEMNKAMEHETWSDNVKCSNQCSKIKTNHAKDKKKLKLKRTCNHECSTKRRKKIKTFHKKYPNELKVFIKNMGRTMGGGGSRRKSKKGKKNSAYFEYKETFGSKKFWRIVKNGSSITTHYGKIGTLGQTTTKNYGMKVDSEYDKLIMSKKKKGYVEERDFGPQNIKPPTKMEREFMKICQKCENSEKLNPHRRNFDCEGMITSYRERLTLPKELKWQIQFYKDSLKNGSFDWEKEREHHKSM